MSSHLRLLLAGLLLVVSCQPIIAADDCRPLVLVIDQSASMHITDPRRYAADAVNLAVATVRSDVPLLVVGFDSGARDLVPWKIFSNVPARAAQRDQLADLEFNGDNTFYVSALNSVFQQLDAHNCPPGTTVIYFTDGDPDDKSDTIQNRAQAFAKRGWVVRAMRLNKDRYSAKPILAQMAQTTRGTHVEIRDAEELVTRFLALIMSENDTFFSSLREQDALKPITVPPGARSVAWIVVSNEGTGHAAIRSLTADGRPVVTERAFRYPAFPGQGKTNLECIAVDDPAPGSYAIGIDGIPGKVYVSLSFAGRIRVLPLPPEINEGDTITPGVEFTFPADAASPASDLANKVQVVATIVDTVNGKVIWEQPLVGTVGTSTLRYASQLRIRLPDGSDRNVNHPLNITYKLRLDGGYQLEKIDSTLLHPRDVPVALMVAFAKGQVTLPSTWVGRPVNGTVGVTTDGPMSVHAVSFAGDEAIRFPTPLPIPVGEGGSLRVEATATAPGRTERRYVGTLDGPLGAGESAPSTPTIIATVYGWQGQDELALTGSGPTPVAGWAVVPQGAPEQRFKGVQAALRSAAGRTLPLTIAADGRATITMSDEEQAGEFAATAELVYGELPPRPVRLVFRHQPAAVELADLPDSLRLAPPAWNAGRRQELAIPVRLASGGAGSLQVKVLGDLKGPNGDALDARYDIAVSVDPPQLTPGAKGVVKVSTLRGQDLSPGEYKGSVELVFTARNGMSTKLTRDLVVVIP